MVIFPSNESITDFISEKNFFLVFSSMAIWSEYVPKWLDTKKAVFYIKGRQVDLDKHQIHLPLFYPPHPSPHPHRGRKGWALWGLCKRLAPDWHDSGVILSDFRSLASLGRQAYLCAHWGHPHRHCSLLWMPACYSSVFVSGSQVSLEQLCQCLR